MKKFILIGIAILMMSSCVKHPDIYVKLTEEDTAAIPYQMGQTVKFLDHNGDTLAFQVIRDITYPYNGEQNYYAIHDGNVFQPSCYYCYARTVVLTCNQNGKRLGFTILPKKEFVFYFGSNGSNFDLNCHLLPNNTYTFDNTDYADAHHEILYSQFSGELMYDWYYNEEFGLLYFQKGDFSLTRIP